MIVPEKPLWGGNNKVAMYVCMYVCMYVGRYVLCAGLTLLSHSSSGPMKITSLKISSHGYIGSAKCDGRFQTNYLYVYCLA